MHEYIKIDTIFNRDTEGSKKLIIGDWRDNTVKFLSNLEWVWTEKIDGTNIGVVWDGHKVSFQGRTERADIPKHLLERLNELFGGNETEELFEQVFGEKEVILFGEGYGHKIQKVGDLYNQYGCDFILFDVYIPEKDLYLERANVESIAKTFGIGVVPIVGMGSLRDAVEYVKEGYNSFLGSCKMEGIVCRPLVEIRNREGKRVIVKIKYHDFE